jgi:hypothetical protein
MFARKLAFVIAGLDPAISIYRARPCHWNRDGRVKPGHDALLLGYAQQSTDGKNRNDHK